MQTQNPLGSSRKRVDEANHPVFSHSRQGKVSTLVALKKGLLYLTSPWGQGMDCENWYLVNYLKREMSLLGHAPFLSLPLPPEAT